MRLDKPSKIILETCMGLEEDETCLIVTDSKLKSIGEALLRNSLKITRKSKLVLTGIPETHGSEPPEAVAKEMLNHDVVLLPTTKSLSHTTARKKASGTGARIASMPGITAEMMERALDVDFFKIKKQNDFLISRLKNRDILRIKTRKGTDAEFHMKGREWISDHGIYTEKGAFGNLPAGEVFIAPLENLTKGTLVVDASVGSLGKTGENIQIEIKDGFLSRIEGGKLAEDFEKSLKSPLYRNVAELGIGTNYAAKITGNVLEDEKVKGTFHVAFGNNKHFGGKVDVPFHVDFVIMEPEFR